MYLPTPPSSVLRRIAANARGATLLAVLFGAALGLAEAPLGDRLVIAVNNVPYTQRQVEGYILIKESLRKTSDGAARIIDDRSWPQALAVFGEDMIVLQEAERLGSNQNEGVLVEKFREVVKQKVKAGRALEGALTRLGLDESGLTRTLESVLRIAALRKAKDRGGEGADTDAKATKRGKWLVELVDRAVVRIYRNADKYLLIEPTAGGKGG